MVSLEKKGRGKEGEVVESGRKVTNFVLPSGYLLLLPKSSGVGWISNTESGTEQRFVWYSPFLQAKKKNPHYPIMLCNPVKFIKPQFPTNINSLLKVLVLVFTRGLPSRDSPHPKPIFFGPILIQIFSFCVSEPDPINIYPMRIKHVSATWN